MKIIDLIPRDYQKNILETCKLKNTLVVMPTGIGKTVIAILLAENRLTKYPESKIIICSPTKPLCSQHVKSFLKYANLKENEVKLYTGATKGSSRIDLWEQAKIIVATPQTIQSDLENERISLENVSLLCIDEAHRSRMKYANTFVAAKYKKESDFPRILALTASPGSSKEKIDEICKNLHIEDIEIRTELDEDVSPYVQEKGIEYVKVDLPEEFNRIKNLIKQVKDDKISDLKHIIPEKKSFNKRDFLNLQFQFRKTIIKGNKMAFWGVSLTAQLLKLSYALELIETQGIKQLIQYWNKLKEDNSKAAKSILNNSKIKKAIKLSLDFQENKHPKMHKLKEIILNELNKKKNSRIIIFANYRNTIDEIYNQLNFNIIKPIILIGQKEGLTQKEQIKRIKEFGEGIYNVLITSSIGEEGLDIVSANLGIFYDHASSSDIRKIQRQGRIGRIEPGKIVFLITKSTADESQYWAGINKERKMKKILYQMKESSGDIKKKLSDF